MGSRMERTYQSNPIWLHSSLLMLKPSQPDMRARDGEAHTQDWSDAAEIARHQL